MNAKKISKECKIIEREVLLKRGEELGEGDVVRLRLKWDGDSYPGCFFQLLPRNEYLRRPISLCGSGEGYIELAIRVQGSGTHEIASRCIGDAVECFGPLGRGFEVGKGGRFLVVGGGIGVAPLQPLVRELRKLNPESIIDFVEGFRDIPYLTEMATHIATEDLEINLDSYEFMGVNCSRGMVGPLVETLLLQNHYDEVFACGPEVMLDALGRMFLERGYDAQLLTEAHFACGVGACLGCTRETNRAEKYARVCADGPMFRASEVVLGAGKCSCGSARSDLDASLDFGINLNTGADAEKYCHERGGAKPQIGVDAEVCSDGALAVSLGGLNLKSLLTMASGTFGFGREYEQFFDIGILGAVSVKGLTLAPKHGNPGRRVVEVSSGMINSVGLQNPGVEHFLKHETALLKSKGVAIIANINGESVEDLVQLAEIVAPYADAVELNISCPNVAAGGMSFGTDPKSTEEVVRAVRKVVDKPLIVKLTPNVTDITEIAKVCEAEGADILSLINTVTGLAVDYKTGRKPLSRGFGGMSGAAVKPIALKHISAVSSSVALPIIGMGGISSARDVIEFLQVGASAVAIGTAIFRDPLLPVKIDADLRKYLQKIGVKTIRELKQ